MKITRSGLPAKALLRTSEPSTCVNSKSGAFVPSGNMVLAVFTILFVPWSVVAWRGITRVRHVHGIGRDRTPRSTHNSCACNFALQKPKSNEGRSVSFCGKTRLRLTRQFEAFLEMHKCCHGTTSAAILGQIIHGRPQVDLLYDRHERHIWKGAENSKASCLTQAQADIGFECQANTADAATNTELARHTEVTLCSRRC